MGGGQSMKITLDSRKNLLKLTHFFGKMTLGDLENLRFPTSRFIIETRIFYAFLMILKRYLNIAKHWNILFSAFQKKMSVWVLWFRVIITEYTYFHALFPFFRKSLSQNGCSHP